MSTNNEYSLDEYGREVAKFSDKKPSMVGEKIDPASHRMPGEFIYNGILLGGFVTHQRLQQIKELDLVETDVLLTSYLKTGTTLTHEIVYLVLHDGDVEKANKEYNFIRIPWVDNRWPDYGDGMAHLKNTEHPRSIKTHLPFFCMPEQLVSKKIRCVYVMRNPKDALVSYYYFYKSMNTFAKFGGLWSDFFEMFLMKKICFGDIFDHYLGWWEQRDRLNILILKYEDLVRHRKREIVKIATFLGKGDLSEDVIDRIAEYTTFKSMEANPKTNYTSVPEVLDFAVSPFMRKGQIGDWKNHFTVGQNEEMDKIIQERLGGTGLGFDYEA